LAAGEAGSDSHPLPADVVPPPPPQSAAGDDVTLIRAVIELKPVLPLSLCVPGSAWSGGVTYT